MSNPENAPPTYILGMNGTLRDEDGNYLITDLIPADCENRYEALFAAGATYLSDNNLRGDLIVDYR